MEQKVNRLTEVLVQEANRREKAERQLGEIGQRRSELEAELAKHNQAQRSCGKSWKRRKSNCDHNRRTPAPNKPSWRHGLGNCRRPRP